MARQFMNRVTLSATCLRFIVRSVVHPAHAAWHSRDILPILRFGGDSSDAGTCETYGPGTLRDRRSVGIESETTQTGIDWGAPRVAPCLRAARSRVGESDQFRPLPSRDLLETTHCIQSAARGRSVQRDNFRDALLPLATAARIYRSRGRGRGGWNVPTAAGSMTREATLPARSFLPFLWIS